MALPGLCADKVHLKLQSGFSDLNILKMRAESLAAIKGASNEPQRGGALCFWADPK
jgi:hypothetical protein